MLMFKFGRAAGGSSFFAKSLLLHVVVSVATSPLAVAGINDMAGVAAGANGAASNTAQNVGSNLLSQGSSEMPQCQQQQCSCCADALMKILMGLMGLAQAGANKGTQGSDRAQGLLSQAGTTTDTSAPAVRTADTVQAAALASKTAKQLAQYGIKLNTSALTATLPDGRTMKAGDIGNPSAMAAAGVSPESYKKIMDSVKDMQGKAPAADLKTADSPTDGFSGGGGGYSPKPPADPEPEAVAMKRLPAAQIAGAVASYKGDPIGTFSDDIFKLMSRRYREKTHNDQFLGADVSPESARARPSSSGGVRP